MRAAVLLRGGVAAPRVLPMVVTDLPDHPELLRIVHRLDEGDEPGRALAAGGTPEWRLLATAWQLSARSGAPLAPALERLSLSLRALLKLRERRRVLLSGPRATTGLVGALPVLAILFGAVLGFDPLPVLFGPAGLVLLPLGSLLMVLGATWTRALIRSVVQEDSVAGFELELVWIALGGGAPPELAMRQTVECADEVRAEWVSFDAFRRDGPVQRAFRAASAVGAPVAPLLLEEAEAVRARAHTELESAAERLGVRILIPLGICTLPAFVVLGVIPVLFAMLGGAVQSSV